MYKSWDKIYLRTMIIIYFLPYFLYQQLHYQTNEYGNSTITSSDKTNWVHVYSLNVFSSLEEFCFIFPFFFLSARTLYLSFSKVFLLSNVREFEKTNSRFKSHSFIFFIFCSFLLLRQSLLQLIWSHFSTLPKFLLFLLSGII